MAIERVDTSFYYSSFADKEDNVLVIVIQGQKMRLEKAIKLLNDISDGMGDNTYLYKYENIFVEFENLIESLIRKNT